MSNLAPSSEYREAEETSSKIKAIAPSAPAPAGDRLGGPLPGQEFATVNPRWRSREIITHERLREVLECPK